MIDVAQIRMDGGTQSRAHINQDTVDDYAEAMADPATVFPPITVYYDGKVYWLADGFHRVLAWQKIGRVEVPAEIRQGDRRQAILHSCAANAAHGLRRSIDDKRRAVMTLLEDDEWSQWSDREIARRCRVSAPFVGKMRGSVTVNVYSEEPRSFITRHGTTAKMDTSNIGKAPPLPTEPPVEIVPSSPAGESGGDGPTVAPATPSEAKTDPNAKLRSEFRAMTKEGQEEDWIALRGENADLRKRVKSQTSMIADLKKEISDLTAGSDLGAKLSAQIKLTQTAKLARDEALAAAKRMEFRMNKALARVRELEGEEMEI